MATQDVYGLVGQVLDGQFRVDRAIGEGGFSVVYRGQHVGLDEPVAIKCLKLQNQLGSALVEAFIRRFRDESKIHYRLSQGSLHIARTIAAGTTMAPAIGAIVPYMVLEWLEGYTLAEELRARRQRGEAGRNIQEVIRLLDPVAEAMAFAHAQGVVHRDLNPSNIFVAYAHGTSKLKVLDFGVAKVISDHALSLGPRAVTVGQIRMFTPAYAAPEQFHDALGPIGPQTDVYSFAVMVVELLIDRAPIEGEHIGEYADRALDPEHRPTPRSMGVTVGDAVEAVIARAVTVDPSQRPGDIGEFWGMLKNAATRDAQLGRSGGEPGFPKPPVTTAPSARSGYVPRTTAGGLPPAAPDTSPEHRPPPWPGKSPEKDGNEGRYSYYSSRPEVEVRRSGAPVIHPAAAAANMGAEFVQTAKSAEDERPATRASSPIDSHVSLRPGTPSPTPGPYAVSQPTPAPAAEAAFAATIPTPVVPGPSPHVGIRSPVPRTVPMPATEWKGPVIRSKSDSPGRAVEAEVPKKSNVPLLVLLALALTVTLVIVAIVANELAR